MISRERADASETPAAAAPAPRVSAAEGGGGETAGLAHVAGLSFLASRASPSGAFVIALAGGVALARAGQRQGARRGYGASLAAMIQTVAYLGPARLNGPLTQALSAPMMGALERRGVGVVGQFAACTLVRIAHNALATALFVSVLLGFDAYVGTFDRTVARLPLVPAGHQAAVAFTALSVLGWGALASAIQARVYRRGLRRWPDESTDPGAEGETEEADLRRRRFDPRAVAICTAIAFGLLVASTQWALLAAVAAWLAAAWLLSRRERGAGAAGVGLALLLGASAVGFSLVGGLGLDVALRRGLRALLLVLVATWLRAAAGSVGIREVARRSLGRLSRLPAVPEAGAILDSLGAGTQLRSAGGALIEALRSARRRPLAMGDAVLDWVAAEAERFRARPAASAVALRLSPADAVLLLATAAPAAALLLG